MKVEPITIVISMHSRIHSVIDQIWSLRENAVCKEHEILLIGDRTHRAPVSCALGCMECGYKTVEEWVKDNKGYLEEVNAQYRLCPDSADWPLDYNSYYGQSRSLYLGTRLAKHNFVLWSSDDFFYTTKWDKCLFEIIDEKEKDRYIYMPWLAEVHRLKSDYPVWNSRGKTITITKDVPYLGDSNCYYIFCDNDNVDINNIEKIFKDNKIICDQVFKEICRERKIMHWFPPLFTKALILPRIPYPMCDKRGWDIYFDDKNGELGTYKIATKKTFMLQFQGIRPKLPDNSRKL